MRILVIECCQCKEKKDSTDFYTNKRSSSGFQYHCKSCQAIRNKVFRLSNPDYAKTYNKDYYTKNKEHMNIQSRLYYKTTFFTRSSENKVRGRKHYSVNTHMYRARDARRRALQKQATPLWANSFFISEIYHLAKLRSKATGFSWHVDHIIPLNGKHVCGLHLETNLQVIPASVNLSKGNSY